MQQGRILLSGGWCGADSQENSAPLPDSSDMSGRVPGRSTGAGAVLVPRGVGRRIRTVESDGPERAPTTGAGQYGALLPVDCAIRMRQRGRAAAGGGRGCRGGPSL